MVLFFVLGVLVWLCILYEWLREFSLVDLVDLLEDLGWFEWYELLIVLVLEIVVDVFEEMNFDELIELLCDVELIVVVDLLVCMEFDEVVDVLWVFSDDDWDTILVVMLVDMVGYLIGLLVYLECEVGGFMMTYFVVVNVFDMVVNVCVWLCD